MKKYEQNTEIGERERRQRKMWRKGKEEKKRMRKEMKNLPLSM